MPSQNTSEDKLPVEEIIAIGEDMRRYALGTLGFSAIGFAKAARVSDDQARHLRQWLDNGGNADMAYMKNWYDKRVDPRLLMPGLKTIVSVALNYAPAHTLPKDEPQISAYALGKDYHDIVKSKLFKLAEWLNQRIGSEDKDGETNNVPPSYRVFVDTGPVLERYWAVQAGLGWIGRNHQLIIPHAGSMFFLGELFLDIELPFDSPMPNRCGSCHRCIDACPTGALGTPPSPNDSSAHHTNGEVAGFFSASLCLSYQTIENRGKLSETAKQKMGDMFYGCDRCQQACPWNRFAKPNDTPELQPSDELLHMTREKWHELSVDDYRRLFKGSAVKRAKYEGLKRNIDNLK